MFFPHDETNQQPLAPQEPMSPRPSYCAQGHSRFRNDCADCVKAWRSRNAVPDHPALPPRGRKPDPKTSLGRFHIRIRHFRERGLPVALHHFWWFVHNCIAHPAIGVVPVKSSFDFHDYTSRKINGL